MIESCPLCGKKTELMKCKVFASLWSSGSRQMICNGCINALRERHMYVVLEEDQRGENPAREELPVQARNMRVV